MPRVYRHAIMDFNLAAFFGKIYARSGMIFMPEMAQLCKAVIRDITKVSGVMVLEEDWGTRLRSFRVQAGYRSQGALVDAISMLTATLTHSEVWHLHSTFINEESGFDFSQAMLSRWETGSRKPPRRRSRHLYLIWALASLGCISSPAEADGWLDLAGLKPLTDGERKQIWPDFEESDLNEPIVSGEAIDDERSFVDWGEAPAVDFFYGREAELAQVTEWLTKEQCRLVGIWGIGGQGKTTLAAQVCRATAPHFDAIIWRSLLNAPPLDEILESWIQLLSQTERTQIPPSLNERLLMLFELLRQRRCLLVLDNAESILQTSPPSPSVAQEYLDYEAYSQLILRFGQSEHRSCLLLTSREEPREFARLRSASASANSGYVETLLLNGLDDDAITKLLTNDTVRGSAAAVHDLGQRYSGNPLALLLVSNTIFELYGGDIDEFWREDEGLFGDIREILAQQVEYLSELERSILYWLAIEREPVTGQTVRENLVLPINQSIFIEALRTLQRRSLIDMRRRRRPGLPKITLQNVVIEYLTESIVEMAWQALHGNIPRKESATRFFDHHALVKATSNSHVRHSQERLILRPVAERLLASEGRVTARATMQQILGEARRQEISVGYTAGNILNLLLYMGEPLSGFDFSHLPVWQATLQNRELSDVDLSYADLSHALLYETSGRFMSLALHPDGQILFAGTNRGYLNAYSLEDLQPLETIGGLGSHITSLAVGMDGHTLVSSGMDGRVRIWALQVPESELQDNGQDTSSETAIQQIDSVAGAIMTAQFSFQETEGVRAVALCLDDTVLACACVDRIRLWDIQYERRFATLTEHSQLINSLSYCQHNALLASGSADGNVFIWRLVKERSRSSAGGTDPSIELLAQLMPSAMITQVAFSPDGSKLACADIDGLIRVWACEDLEKGDKQQPKISCAAHTGRIDSLAFSPDGMTLASGGHDKALRIWRVTPTELQLALQTSVVHILALQFGPDGSSIVCGNQDKTLRLWDINEEIEIHRLGSFRDGSMSTIDIHPDGSKLACGSDDGALHIWDLATHDRVATIHEHDDLVFSVAYSPNGETIASGSVDSSICIYDSDSGKVLYRLLGHSNEVTSVAYAPHGKSLVSSSSDQTIRLWNLQTGDLLQTWQSPGGAVWSIMYSPDGDRVIGGCTNGSVYVWSAKSGEVVSQLSHHRDVVWCITVSPDGKWIASAGYEGEICLWDAATGNLVRSDLHHGRWVRSLAFSHDSERLASSGDNRHLCLWDVQTGNELYQTSGNSGIAFHPKGEYLAASDDKWLIQLREVETGVAIGQLIAQRPWSGTDITGIKGISSAQRETLTKMGAFESDGPLL